MCADYLPSRASTASVQPDQFFDASLVKPSNIRRQQEKAPLVQSPAFHSQPPVENRRRFFDGSPWRS
jgi:hypothetical protein